MKVNLRNRVAQHVAMMLAKLIVEMLDREIRVAIPEQTQHPLDLARRSPPRRGLPKPPVRKPAIALRLEPDLPPPEGAFVDPQHLGGLDLADLPALVAVQ